MKRPGIRSVVVLAVVAVLVLASVPAWRHGYDAILLLADLGDIDWPLPDSRPETMQLEIRFDNSGRRQAADVHLPRSSARAGLVLVPGAAEAGRKDPRLVEFAQALARSGFVVLVPDIVSLRELRLTAENAAEISAAVTHLRAAAYMRPGMRLGIGAFSVATGPAVLAALEQEKAARVDFLLLVGGYYDLERTLTYLMTGYFQVDGERSFRQPDSYGKWVYALGNASRLPDGPGRVALQTLARRRLDDPQAGVEDLLPQLGSTGLRVYEFIENTDPDRVPELIQSLPREVRADIEQLDLARRDLSALHAEVLLVHGMDDDVIPYIESLSLQAALAPGQARVFLLQGLHHVDRDFGGLDAWRMWKALRVLFEISDPQRG